MPDEKRAVVKQLKEEGEVAAMMGDGINVAPALAIVDVAMGGNAHPRSLWAGGYVERHAPREEEHGVTDVQPGYSCASCQNTPNQ